MALELSTSLTDIPRELGRYGGATSGPLVICIGGMHGNEPAGVFALRRVCQTLQSAQPPFRGEFVAFSGNRTALARRCRYVIQDFNRLWTAERMTALQQSRTSPPQSPEEEEQEELFTAIKSALKRQRGPVIFLDLHTTSADGIAFTVISDTSLNRHLALSIPAPVILGLEEHLDGTTLNYINDLGYIAVGFEGGQHEAPASIDHHEAAIWTVLQTAGCLGAEAVPQARTLRSQLARSTKAAPRIVEIRHHHVIQEGDQFVMEPGFCNFQAVKRGQLLARDRHGDIRAHEDGLILMPLYQSQGADGFFLVREVKPFWLQVAFWVRRLRCERLLPWLPGVRQHPILSDTLLVNRRIARWFVLELFHLLGFRKQRVEGELLVVSRRPHKAFSFKKW